MPFQKVSIGRDIIFKIEILDINGSKMDTWKFMKGDFPKVVRMISKKYGLNISIVEKEFDREDREDRDLDWIK